MSVGLRSFLFCLFTNRCWFSNEWQNIMIFDTCKFTTPFQTKHGMNDTVFIQVLQIFQSYSVLLYFDISPQFKTNGLSLPLEIVDSFHPLTNNVRDFWLLLVFQCHEIIEGSQFFHFCMTSKNCSKEKTSFRSSVPFYTFWN